MKGGWTNDVASDTIGDKEVGVLYVTKVTCDILERDEGAFRSPGCSVSVGTLRAQRSMLNPVAVFLVATFL